MKAVLIGTLSVAATLACSAPALADAWKDESGTEWYGDYNDRGDWDDYDEKAHAVMEST